MILYQIARSMRIRLLIAGIGVSALILSISAIKGSDNPVDTFEKLQGIANKTVWQRYFPA